MSPELLPLLSPLPGMPFNSQSQFKTSLLWEALPGPLQGPLNLCPSLHPAPDLKELGASVSSSAPPTLMFFQ